MEIQIVDLVYAIVAIVFSALISYTMTPPVRVLAYKLGAIDVPRDSRRMHKEPIPRLGGISIYAAFVLATLVFCDIDSRLVALWFGGLLIVILGIFDDIYRLNAWLKLAVQLVVAIFAVLQGIQIESVNLFGHYINFGYFSYPITVIWIVGITNAINLIDGLDGLACGVSAICSTSMLFVALLVGDYASAMLTAILTAACVGFLPFNSNPARIFMGDTGALFLGYTLAVISVEGLFKLHAVISFVIPVAIFALPLFDTSFAIIRRLFSGKSPFTADRGHLHHKLIDMGFTHKQTVKIIYAFCALLGTIAIAMTDVMFGESRYIKTAFIVGGALIVLILNLFIMRRPSARRHSGLIQEEKAETPADAGKDNCDETK